jgi:hypothetical protein
VAALRETYLLTDLVGALQAPLCSAQHSASRTAARCLFQPAIICLNCGFCSAYTASSISPSSVSAQVRYQVLKALIRLEVRCCVPDRVQACLQFSWGHLSLVTDDQAQEGEGFFRKLSA